MNSCLSLLNHVPFPISTKPLTVSFPSKKMSNFRVDITKGERRLFERKKDEAYTYYEKTLANLSKEEKKEKIISWINKNLQGKNMKKQETVDFGDVLGRGKFDLMLFMLTAIGVTLPEGMELRREVKTPEKRPPARKHTVEEKKEKEANDKEFYDEDLASAQKRKEDEEFEKFYEEEEARALLNAAAARKHTVEGRKEEDTKSEGCEDLADAENLKEMEEGEKLEEEARDLLIAAIDLLIAALVLLAFKKRGL